MKFTLSFKQKYKEVYEFLNNLGKEKHEYIIQAVIEKRERDKNNKNIEEEVKDLKEKVKALEYLATKSLIVPKQQEQQEQQEQVQTHEEASDEEIDEIADFY